MDVRVAAIAGVGPGLKSTAEEATTYCGRIAMQRQICSGNSRVLSALGACQCGERTV